VAKLARALHEVSNKYFTIGGELIALDYNGAPDFYAIPKAILRDTVAFCAFDVLHLGTRDMRALPLIERKQLLGSHMPVGARAKAGRRTGRS
jgi:ATP-dependent DNA ligase